MGEMISVTREIKFQIWCETQKTALTQISSSCEVWERARYQIRDILLAKQIRSQVYNEISNEISNEINNEISM